MTSVVKLLSTLPSFVINVNSMGKSPGRFKFNLKDDIEFNHTVIVDALGLEGDSAVQVVEEATGLISALFLEKMSTKEMWFALRHCWVDIYQGPPQYIVHDPGTNFASTEFRQNAKILNIEVQEMPIETHHSMGKVESYHMPLRRAS